MLNVSPMNLLFTVINLLVLLFLMKKFLYKPVLNIIAKRQELIDRQFSEADAAKKEAEQLKEDYESRLADAEQENKRCVQEAKDKARAEYDRILAEADEKAAKMMEDAKAKSEDEHAKAVEEAQKEITKLAVAAAARIVADAQSSENDKNVYDDFLKKAGEMSETGSR